MPFFHEDLIAHSALWELVVSPKSDVHNAASFTAIDHVGESADAVPRFQVRGHLCVEITLALKIRREICRANIDQALVHCVFRVNWHLLSERLAGNMPTDGANYHGWS